MNYCSWASFLASKFRDHQTYFSDQISDRNSWRIPESPAFFVQEFWKNFRDRYLWTFPVTKRLLFRREFWSIASHEEFQGHLLFVTGKYSLWHKNPVFEMNYRSWTSFLTSGFEIIKHIFPTGFPIGILEEFRSHLLLSCRNSWIIFETDTYEIFLSPNGYFFDGNSDRLELMKNSRVICFFSQKI